MYMILAIICALGEAGGWAFRANSSFNEFDFTGYVAQLVLLIFSPVFISATTYVIFCRIMDELGHHWSLIPRNWYIGTFVSEFTVDGEMKKDCLMAGISHEMCLLDQLEMCYRSSYNLQEVE